MQTDCVVNHGDGPPDAKQEWGLRSIARTLRTVPEQKWLRPWAAASSLRALLHQRRIIRRINASGLFDRDYYLTEYNDVALSGGDPVEHFVLQGASEGRNPHPLFETSFYLVTNQDVARSGMNPLVHFLLHGWKELRKPHPLFDTGFYLRRYPDVASVGMNPLVHYLEHGACEGRDPSPDFDTRVYLAEHPEAGTAGGNPLLHHVRALRQPRIGTATAGIFRGVLDPPMAEIRCKPLDRWRIEISTRPRRALVVDATLLTPDRDSGSLTTLELMKALHALGYAVTFIPADLEHSDHYVEALQAAGFCCLTKRAVPSMQGFLKAYGGLFEVVVLCRLDVGRILIDSVKAHCPEAVVLFETMDLHYLRAEREAAMSGSSQALREAHAVKADELRVVRRSHVTIVHSEVEKELLQREEPEARVYQMGYVIDVQGAGPGFADRSDVLFLGGFRHKPNVDAVNYFVNEIFPRLRRELPGVRFLVVGSDPPEEVQRLGCDDVIVTGYVEKLKPVFDACRVSVAPLRYGAGYKGKVAMSMSYGVPSVLSSMAAEGMQLANESQVLIADDTVGFAAAVIRLYREPALWERLSNGGLEFVAQHFSRESSHRRLDHILRAAGAQPQSEGAGKDRPRRGKSTEQAEAINAGRLMREIHR